MLVLTRRVGERLMIGEDIIITVNKVTGNQVTIGIKAPDAVPIHREEIYDRLKAENKISSFADNAAHR